MYTKMQPVGSTSHAKPDTSFVTAYNYVCPSAVFFWHANYEVIIFTLLSRIYNAFGLHTYDMSITTEFLTLIKGSVTRGHHLKLRKEQSRLNIRKYFSAENS